MILRHLEFLTALARERHFGRAAAVCNVSQSTLSAGIKQMEESLGFLIVERGQRYVGLTPEGAKVLEWAQHVMLDFDGLQQALAEMRSGLGGQLKIGAIPVALPIVSLLTTPFAKLHSHTTVVIRSLPSVEIQRGIDDFSLDIGVTYLDNEPLVRVRRLQLYSERYVLVVRDHEKLKEHKDISWSEAATFPLCLLTSDMQNRRILDMHFREAGVVISAVIEANSLISLWSHLRYGHWATVVPHSFLPLLGDMHGIRVLPLVEPEVTHTIGLVASSRDPLPPVARAFLDVVKQFDLSHVIAKRLG